MIYETKKIQIIFSSIINEEINNFAEKIEKRNTKLKSYFNSKDFVFIINSKLVISIRHLLVTTVSS